MSDIRQWLDPLGLGQHANAFEQNSIEWRHLSDPDHEALKELGVQATGHRMTLPRAIEPRDSVAEADPTSSKHPVQLNPSGDAKRSVRAALDLVEAAEALEHPYVKVR